MPAAPPAPPQRVTLRTLAGAAEVSVQAVSLALRNHPSIGRDTRARIQELARKFGYVPDPALVKLMHHLRAKGGPTTGANLCALTTRPPDVPEAFCDLVLEGAREAAQSAGFALQVLHVDTAADAGRRAQRVLRSRGVEGLVLLPMADLRPLDDLVDWSQFSVVSATLSVTSPHFNRVVADHFKNVFTLCERLHAAGYRRLGLVIRSKHDRRCGHSITASHAWHGIYGGVEPLRAHVCEQLEPVALQRWLEHEQPDVLLAEHDDIADALRRQRALTERLPIVSCSARPRARGEFPFPGIYDEPRQIGAVAVELLTRMIAQGQRGVPRTPHTTLIGGAWVGALSTPRRSAHSKPQMIAAGSQGTRKRIQAD